MRRALGFLTSVGGAVEPDPAALYWFGPVGAAIGLAVGGIWWAAQRAWAPAAAAALALGADVALTGYLHLDGLADAADGLLPPLERNRRLVVMTDPSVGAFGLVTVCSILLLRFGALASARAAPLAVAALWCASRTAMATVALTFRYARKGGLAQPFLDRPSTADPSGPHGGDVRPILVAASGAAIAVGLAVAARGTHGLAAIGGELVAIALVLLLALRRIGGFTGDVLGALGVVGETAGLLVLAARW